MLCYDSINNCPGGGEIVSKNSVLLVIVALLIGIFIGFAVERQRAISNMETAKLSLGDQISKMGVVNEKLMVENKHLQMMLTPTPTGEVTPSPSTMPK